MTNRSLKYAPGMIACLLVLMIFSSCGKNDASRTSQTSSATTTPTNPPANTAGNRPTADVPTSVSTANNTPIYRPIDTEEDGFRVTCQSTHSAVDSYGIIVKANVIDFTAIATNIDPRVNGTKIILLASGNIVDGKLETKDYGTFQIRSGGSVVMMTDDSIAKIRKALQDAAKPGAPS